MTRIRTGWLALVLVCACTDRGPASTETLEALNARLQELGDSGITLGDTCTRFHHLWRDQLRLALLYADSSRSERHAAFRDALYKPHERFWAGYVGGEKGFVREIADKWSELERDPRAAAPLDHDVAGLILQANRLASTLAGRPQRCSDWYLLYGPGWANMGGLGTGEMLVDFFGITDIEEDLSIYLPHEVAHVLYAGRPVDPDDGTLLASILSEGFATYFSVVFHEGRVSPAQALGYSTDEWNWAEANEARLWGIAAPDLATRDEERIRVFRAAGERILPDAPGKIGYFIGYRIVESYVARHGPGSWVDFFDLPLNELVRRSGYAGEEH